MSQLPPRPTPRWWPVALLALLLLLALVAIWLPDQDNRQDQYMQTGAVFVLTGLLGLVWLLAFSRLAWRWRLGILAVFLALALGLGQLHVVGFTGDMVPILNWSPNPEDTFLDGGSANSITAGAPYPQFLGPQRNAVLSGYHLDPDWKARPPTLLWKRSVGPAWSAFAVLGPRAVTQEQAGPLEQVVCYDLGTGQILWTHSDSTRYQTPQGGIGPRATPTLDRGRVYTVGATGLLNCLDLASGALLWQRDIVAENDAQAPHWGLSGSPLLLDTLVVVSAGGPKNRSLVAYHRDTGAFIWGGGQTRAGYSSPTLATLADTPQIVIFNSSTVAGHDPGSGALLWEQEWPSQHPCVAQPVPLPGDRLLVSSGYGVGSKLFFLDRTSRGDLQPAVVWESIRLKAKFTNVVHDQGFVYGLDDGILTCIDLRDGSRRWKRGRYGHGQLILVDDLLLIQAENGDLALVRARPEAFAEVARMTVLQGKTWNNPALAPPYLLVRNHLEAACYHLEMSGPETAGLIAP